MDKREQKYAAYVSILEQELLPAFGCTEPIALAMAGAKAKELLHETPDSVRIAVSANIIKNVKSVAIPSAGGMKGIAAAVVSGIVAGDASLGLEVLSGMRPESVALVNSFLQERTITVCQADNDEIFYIDVRLESGMHSSRAVIRRFHTNFTLLEQDGECLLCAEETADEPVPNKAAYSQLNVQDIVDFADTVDLPDVSPLLERQISYNMAISDEGLANNWGSNIGSVLRASHPADDLCIRAASAAAAGSDARMSGCEKPVIIVSGSGNQGITASVPVVVYANALGAPHEKLLRALVVANLTTIHQKTRIGRLSAFCGAASAGGGAAAGIAYLCGGGYVEIAHTLSNAIGILSGMVCDGAKPSCAAKIAASVQAGILGYEMFRQGQEFLKGDGIIGSGIETTIRNVGEMASSGMRTTDKEILRIMLQDC